MVGGAIVGPILKQNSRAIIRTAGWQAVRVQLAKEAFHLMTRVERNRLPWPTNIERYIGVSRNTEQVRDELISHGCNLRFILGCCKELSRNSRGGRGSLKKLLMPVKSSVLAKDIVRVRHVARRIKQIRQIPIFDLEKSRRPDDEEWYLISNYLIA